MEYIKRMEEELEQLETRIDKLNVFLNKEIDQSEKTTELERIKMALQLHHMKDYYTVLKDRIGLSKEKERKSCSTSSNYDEVVEDCFKNK